MWGRSQQEETEVSDTCRTAPQTLRPVSMVHSKGHMSQGPGVWEDSLWGESASSALCHLTQALGVEAAPRLGLAGLAWVLGVPRNPGPYRHARVGSGRGSLPSQSSENGEEALPASQASRRQGLGLHVVQTPLTRVKAAGSQDGDPGLGPRG